MTIPSWARPGVKVVCVLDFTKARIVNDLGYRRLPAVGQTYTVREAYVCSYGIPVAMLAEFEQDRYFDLRGFRPLVEPKSEAEDVALFRHHLTESEEVQ